MKSLPPLSESPPPLPPCPPPDDEEEEEEEEADEDADEAVERLAEAEDDDALELDEEPPKRFAVALNPAVAPPLLAEDVEATEAPVEAALVWATDDSCEPLSLRPPPPPGPPLDAVIITAPPLPPMDVTTVTPPPRRPRNWGTVRDTYRSATVTPDRRKVCSS